MQSLSLRPVSALAGTRKRANWLWFAAGLLLFAALAIYLVGPRFKGLNPLSDEFAISASDLDGRMRVTWNRNATVLEKAESGILEVQDGDQQASYRVDRAVLQQGTLEYLRHGPDLLLKLTVYQEGRPIHVSMIRSVGMPVKAR